MIKVSICPAVLEDAQAIAQLNESCFGRAYPEASVEKQLKTILLRSDEKLLVAVYRGRMIGYIHARDDLRTYRAPRKVVTAVAVEKEFRRKGVGRALVEAVEQWAEHDGCEAVTAFVGGSKAAQSFFAGCGCQEHLNRKLYEKSVGEKVSPFVERLEKHGKKDD